MDRTGKVYTERRLTPARNLLQADRDPWESGDEWYQGYETLRT